VVFASRNAGPCCRSATHRGRLLRRHSDRRGRVAQRRGQQSAPRTDCRPAAPDGSLAGRDW
jgi:hypothetical protein